ncbi:hypothetical protein [Serratia proteamaculans]|uniref:hypothetical protein n=1 Tax=Serratia proteamaculans TaxID=28151 RepID=UPI002179A0D4|nr:hypothetical protein [Serratia proteamaculans]CAI1979778.1 Uncharacterised protein [Serratia proteamaculans]
MSTANKEMKPGDFLILIDSCSCAYFNKPTDKFESALREEFKGEGYKLFVEVEHSDEVRKHNNGVRNIVYPSGSDTDEIKNRILKVFKSIVSEK